MALFRYYSQLDDVACELCENENGFFSETETGDFVFLRSVLPACGRTHRLL